MGDISRRRQYVLVWSATPGDRSENGFSLDGDGEAACAYGSYRKGGKITLVSSKISLDLGSICRVVRTL